MTLGGWESVTNPLDRLPERQENATKPVGNQLPILLIDFRFVRDVRDSYWESVTNPLDRLQDRKIVGRTRLGISYQSS